VLVITAQRDDVEIDWPPAVDHPITVRMPLEPLERGEAGELVRAVFGRPAIEALIDQLYERSGGNPLFLTELAELARENPESTALPGSLRALIAARLDRLPAHQRAIIDNASVLGAQGTAQALGHFAAEMGQSFDVADLEALAHDGLLEVRGNEWRFRSDVVREVAYQTLTKLVRAQRHAGTAAVMAELPFVPSDQVAHHAARAAELVAEIGPVPGVASDVAERAARLLHDAAHRSLEMGAFNQAVRHTTRALDLGVDDDHLARELLLFRAQAQTERRAGETARADALDALERSLEAGDRCHEAIGRRVLGVLHQRDGDLTAARRELGASVDIFRELDDDVELSVSLRERGFAEVFGGSLSDAEWLLGEAEALSERLEDRRGRAWVRQHQAWVAFLSGDTELAETRLLTAAQEFDLLGDRSGGGWAMGLLAYVRFYQRRFDEAEKLALRVRAESIQMGDPWAPAMMDSLIAGIRLWTCRFSEAEELARRALSAFRQIGDRFGAIQAMSARLRALVALGRLYEAERGMEEALAISDSFGDLSFPAMTAAGAAVHMGIGERAVLLAEIALARSTAMGAERSEPLTTLALALCQVGRADEALAHVEEANARSPYVAAVVSLTAALVGDDAAAIEAADAVWDEGGSTYLDRVIADVAAATAFASTGDVEAARCRLERARATALDAGDVVARELAVSVTAAIEGEPSPPDADHLGPGWRRVVADVAVRSGSAPSTRSHTPAPSP
jgi:tetratricopeptide (TPR) repeat protein